MKTKINSKLLISLSIMLLALLVFSINTVNATSISQNTTAVSINEIVENKTSTANKNSLDNLPDTLDVKIPSSKAVEYGYLSTELFDIIEKKVKETTTDDITGLELLVFFQGEVESDFIDISKISVGLFTNEVIAQKTITVKYTDWNKSDKQYVENKCKNLNFELNTTLVDIDEVEFSDEDISKEFSKLINDSSIDCSFYANKGDWAFPSYNALGNLAISKNGAVYYINNHAKFEGVPSISIPQSVENTEKAIIDYSLSKMKTIDYLKEAKLTLEKGSKENEYILDIDGYVSSIIIKKENKIVEEEPVVSTDEKTNITLETTEGVVPENTVMEVKKVEKKETLNVVKKSLKDVSDKFIVFDITLKSEGVKIQPDGKVKISIPVPSNFDTSKLVVYRIEDNGTKIEFKVEVKTVDNVKYAQFETDHFSNYALAEKTVDNNKVLDDEPKTGETNYLIFTTIIAIISICGIVVVKSKK